MSSISFHHLLKVPINKLLFDVHADSLEIYVEIYLRYEQLTTINLSYKPSLVSDLQDSQFLLNHIEIWPKDELVQGPPLHSAFSSVYLRRERGAAKTKKINKRKEDKLTVQQKNSLQTDLH